MDKVLSQEEIDAMVRVARGGQPVTSLPAQQVVQPWDIRQTGQIGSEQMRAINQLHEVFARNLTHAVGAYLGIAFDCSLVSAEHLTYREFLQRLPETPYLASCDLLPVGAVAVLQLDLSVAFPVIDLLLGGEGKGGDLGREITHDTLQDLLLDLGTIEKVLDCRTQPCVGGRKSVAAELDQMRQQPRPHEVEFGSMQDCTEIGRVSASYMLRLGADDARLGRVGQFIWLRLKLRTSHTDLLFRLGVEPQSVLNVLRPPLPAGLFSASSPHSR